MKISAKPGPFVGMTYSGRQVFDATTKQSAILSKTAIVRTAERRKDALSPENFVYTGDPAYLSDWKMLRKSYMRTRALQLVMLMAMIPGVALPFFWTPESPTTFGNAIGFVFALLTVLLSWVCLCDARNGFGKSDGEHAFRRLAGQCWGIGDKCLYIVEGSLDGAPPRPKAVFYDVIGSVDIEQTPEGLDIVKLRSRDGSLISVFLSPATAETDNPRVVADAIFSRIKASETKGRRTVA